MMYSGFDMLGDYWNPGFRYTGSNVPASARSAATPPRQSGGMFVGEGVNLGGEKPKVRPLAPPPPECGDLPMGSVRATSPL